MARDNSKLAGFMSVNQAKEIKAEKKVDATDKKEELVAADRLKQEVQEAREKKTMEDTHIRTTFLMDRKLQARLDTLSSTQPRGFKTKFLNIAIESLLDDLEN